MLEPKSNYHVAALVSLALLVTLALSGGFGRLSEGLLRGSTSVGRLGGSSALVALDMAAAAHMERSVRGPVAAGAVHVLVLLGTRPEAVKLAPVILALRARGPRVVTTVVSTGQHAAMLAQTLRAFGLEAAAHLSLDVMRPDQTLDALTARTVEAVGVVLRGAPPGLVLVQGDTTSAFVGALVAFYYRVPVGHVEAGLRTWDAGSPFPEEFNRQAISLIASLHFAATALAARNLAAQQLSIAPSGVHRSAVFVTGNTVVDALRIFVAPPPTPLLLAVRTAAATRCGVTAPCRLVLLTAHRRENHGAPLVRIMEAMGALLASFPDILVAYPVHLNPNVRASIRAAVPAAIFQQLVPPAAAEEARDVVVRAPAAEPAGAAADAHWTRLLLLEPLDYPDLVRAENESTLIITDSGGIQEEGAALGKFVLVLRENTERPEGVLAGVAELVGTDVARIVAAATARLGDAAAPPAANDIYGDGFAAERIADLSLWFLGDRAVAPPFGAFDYAADAASRKAAGDAGNPSADALLQLAPPAPVIAGGVGSATFDLVMILTVWRKPTLDLYFRYIERQDVFAKRGPNFRVLLLVFQNGDHVNVTDVVSTWSAPGRWGAARVSVRHVHSTIATGYYGRFLAPLLASVRDDSYFIVCDDDMIFGSRYISNMLRVVDGGNLATRNGRFVSYHNNAAGEFCCVGDSAGASEQGFQPGLQSAFAEDIPYDYGGHLWAGRVGWLRTAWSDNPPRSLVTAEDFWLSATLKTRLGIGTKRARCPVDDIEQCACSHSLALQHSSVEVGAEVGGEEMRGHIMATHVKSTGYEPLPISARNFEGGIQLFGHFWPIAGTIFEDCAYFS